MTDREKMRQVVGRLKERYPDAVCSLDYGGEPWKLLVMGRLSAQCTDARVNIVCKELFERFPTAEALASADLAEIENIVRPCGLFRVKAADIKAACERLCSVYGGALPSEMDELLTFPGVGRKVANLLIGDLFGLPAVVTDTHCIRICGRLGFYPETLKDPKKIEKILTEIVDPSEQSDFCHRLVLFGRDICSAQAKKCDGCPLFDLCPSEKR